MSVVNGDTHVEPLLEAASRGNRRRTDGIVCDVCIHMNSTDQKMALDVLRCPTCNAPVPLGDADNASCPYCASTFEIPDRYRALRDAERQKAAERTDAEALYRTLGHPPGLIARAWGDVAIGCVWLVLWPFAFVIDGLLIARLLDVVSRSIHATLSDVLPNTVVWTGIGVVLYVTLAIPTALGIYGKRRTNGRRLLQAALACLPSDRPGGPARCHSCSAPLDVTPGALGLACLYCGADNLVAMPESWVAKVRSSARELGSRIEDVGREDRELRSLERRSLRRQLAWLLIFIPVMTGFGAAFDHDSEAFPPNYRTAIAGNRTFISASRTDTGPYDKFVPPPIIATGDQVRLAFDKSEQGDGYFIRSYLVPLRYRERVAFTSGIFPDGARALMFTFRTQANSIFGDDWRQQGKDVLLYPNSSAEYIAPRSAWYRVDVLMIDEVAPGRPFRVGVSVAPAQPTP